MDIFSDDGWPKPTELQVIYQSLKRRVDQIESMHKGYGILIEELKDCIEALRKEVK